MSQNGYHLRVTVKKEEAPKLTEQLVCLLNPQKYVVGFEKKGDNEHIHCHLEFTEDKTNYHNSAAGKTWRSALFKKLGYAGAYNFQKVEKTDEKNILYVIKELSILKHNFSDEEFDDYKQKTEIINEDKKKDTRHKLLELIKQKVKDIPPVFLSDLDDIDGDYQQGESAFYKLNPKYPHKLSQIALLIHNIYIDEWDKDPPTVHMRGYVLYISQKLQTINNIDEYYTRMFGDPLD